MLIFFSCSQQQSEQQLEQLSGNVIFPDANLAAAIRGTLRLEQKDQITIQNLKELNTLFALSKNIADLTGLEHATNLSTLELYDNNINDITPLTNLTNLMGLYLGGNQINDITQIGKIKSLTKLSLYRNPIQDISPLNQLTNLSELNIGNSQITDISPLVNHTQLLALYLGDDTITDITPLTHLKQLIKLSLYDTPVSDITILKELTQLETLYLRDNQISDLSPISELKNLKELYLLGNQIRDISQLSDLSQLKELSLGQNQISDISPLSKLTQLEKLVLYGNRITDISPLEKLTQLKELKLMGNQITDISSLSKLTQLTFLGLEYNKIQDIKPIENLKNLKNLSIKQNPIVDVTPIYTLYKNNSALNTGDPPYPPIVVEHDNPDCLPDGAIVRLGKGGINVIRFSHDGKYLVVGTDIGVWIYETPTRTVIPLSKRTIGQVNAIAFSPDGYTVATGGNSNPVIQLWDVRNGEELSTLSLPSAMTVSFKPFRSTAALTFARGGTTLVSIAENGHVTHWDVATGDIIEKFHTDHDIWSSTFSLSEQGVIFARGFSNGEIWLRDTFSGAIEAKLRGHKPYFSAAKKNTRIRSLKFSPDGTMLASGSDDKTVRLWNTKRHSKKATLKGHTGWITAIAFSTNGKTVASGDTDSTIRVWDVQKKKQHTILKGHTNTIVALTFSLDGKTLASASADGTIRFWITRTWKEETIFASGHTEWVRDLAFSDDDTSVSTAMFNSTVQSYDVKTGRQLKDFNLEPQHQTYAVKLSDDASLLACHVVDGAFAFNGQGWRTDRYHQGVGKINVWDIKNSERLPTPLNAFGKMAFSPDNSLVAANSSAGISSWVVTQGMSSTLGGSDQIGVWDVQSGKILYSFGINSSSPSSPLIFSPDGTKLALTASFGPTYLWNLQTQQEFVEELDDQNTYMVFSPDSRMFAINAGSKISLWEIISDTQIQKCHTLNDVSRDGYVMIFSPDAQILLIAISSTGPFYCRDVEIQLWDIATSTKLVSLPGHTEPIQTLKFSHDGKTLASGSKDGTVLLWNWNDIIRDIMLENRWQNHKR